MKTSQDQQTADKFATSWNSVYDASVYTPEQFADWIAPWDETSVAGQSVLELGCGSGALLFHLCRWKPSRLVGVDLGDSVRRAGELLAGQSVEIERGDLTDHADLLQRLGPFDRVYSIGVLHHLKEPERGVDSLIAMTRPGGHFHGWVYAHEGNAVVRYIVDPLRKLANRLPWRFNKYLIALPLALPFFLYSKTCRLLAAMLPGLKLPMMNYMLWIGKRDLRFHHHVAFDQLVTPVTHYIRRERVVRWLSDPRVDPDSRYIVFRNGNGWKFGGRRNA